MRGGDIWLAGSQVLFFVEKGLGWVWIWELMRGGGGGAYKEELFSLG